MQEEELEQTLNSMIREEIERAASPDARAIAQRIITSVPRELLAQYAENNIVDRVTHYMAYERRRVGLAKAHSPTSARWEQVSEDQESGALDLARFAVFTGAERKWLLDCTAADLDGAAEYHQGQADTHEHASVGYEKLANHLRRARGAEVVGDLSAPKVKGLLSA